MGLWDASVCDGHSNIGRIYVILDSNCWKYEYHYLILAFVIRNLLQRAVGTNQVGPVYKALCKDI